MMSVHYTITHPVALDVRFGIKGFSVLLGRSGEGKSTLLKAIAGLLPASGTLFRGLPVYQRPIGYLPQGYALFPHLSIWKNVAFTMHGNRSQRRRKAIELLHRVNLGELADRPPNTLSGGQQQRVALARALARAPDLLLLDEPTSALDTTTQEQVLEGLIELVHGLGIPALAATHDPQLAAMADHVVVLSHGRIIQQGPPAEVFNAPQTADVARLLGYRNLFQGQVTQTGKSLIQVACRGINLQIATTDIALPMNAAVLFALRADDIQVDKAHAASSPRNNCLTARIVRLRAHGVGLQLFCDAGLGTDVAVLVPRHDQHTEYLRVGDQVTLSFAPSSIRLLRETD